MEISQPTPAQLEDFEKALIWKCAQAIDAEYQRTREFFKPKWTLGLFRQSDTVACFVVVPEDLVCAKVNEDGKLEYFRSVFYFSTDHNGASSQSDFICAEFKKDRLPPSELLDESSSSMLVRAAFTIDSLSFGDDWKRSILKLLWKEAEAGMHLLVGTMLEIPPPEKLVLEWAIASGERQTEER